MNKNTFLSLIVSLFLVVIQAQNLNQSIPVSSEVEIGQLENGLTYYLQNNQKPDKFDQNNNRSNKQQWFSGSKKKTMAPDLKKPGSNKNLPVRESGNDL